jgi:hypothetical protein
MNRCGAMAFIGLIITVLILFALSHYIVAFTFMTLLANPYIYISEHVLGFLLLFNVNGYLAIIVSMAIGAIVYAAGIGVIGYLFVIFPTTRRKTPRNLSL